MHDLQYIMVKVSPQYVLNGLFYVPKAEKKPKGLKIGS